MKEQFIQFLKDHKVYNAFILYLKDEDLTFDEFCELWIEKEEDPFGLISSAFDWHNTKEGVSFWNDLNNKWISTIE